jgi:peptidase M48, ste24p
MAAYNSKMHEFEQQSAGEQAEALGASPAHPDDDPLEYRYTNLVAELSLAAGIPAPNAYILRDDDSINAFALSGINDSLALAVSRGALDNLTRDELQGGPRPRIWPHRKRRSRTLQPPQCHARGLLHRQSQRTGTPLHRP